MVTVNRNKNFLEHIKNAFLADSRFGFCLDDNLLNEDLIIQFKRIYGVSGPKTSDNMIVAMVNKIQDYTN